MNMYTQHLMHLVVISTIMSLPTLQCTTQTYNYLSYHWDNAKLGKYLTFLQAVTCERAYADTHVPVYIAMHRSQLAQYLVSKSFYAQHGHTNPCMEAIEDALSDEEAIHGYIGCVGALQSKSYKKKDGKDTEISCSNSDIGAALSSEMRNHRRGGIIQICIPIEEIDQYASLIYPEGTRHIASQYYGDAIRKLYNALRNQDYEAVSRILTPHANTCTYTMPHICIYPNMYRKNADTSRVVVNTFLPQSSQELEKRISRVMQNSADDTVPTVYHITIEREETFEREEPLHVTPTPPSWRTTLIRATAHATAFGFVASVIGACGYGIYTICTL